MTGKRNRERRRNQDGKRSLKRRIKRPCDTVEAVPSRPPPSLQTPLCFVSRVYGHHMRFESTVSSLLAKIESLAGTGRGGVVGHSRIAPEIVT